MIHLDPATAFLLYLSVSLAALFLVWFRSYWSTRKKDWIAPESVLYRCEYCQHVYLDQCDLPVTHCPLCESFNKENRYIQDDREVL